MRQVKERVFGLNHTILRADEQNRIEVAGIAPAAPFKPYGAEAGVAIFAEVSSADRLRFQNIKSGYFVVSTQQKPAPPPVIQVPDSLVQYNSRVFRSHFGSLGDLIEPTAYAGREFRLFRMDRGTSKPTTVAVDCSD